jgi:ubiquinone/menaquinone biosynthesis C-methylase UbiE
MGFYERRVFPRLNDALTSTPPFERLRAEALAPARGRVLEIGFGSGLSLPHYPPGVRTIVALEPSAGMRTRTRARLPASRVPVTMVAGTAEHLPIEAHSIDTAVSLLTLCSVVDPGGVLAELRRVLTDEGQLLLVEHGLAPDAGVRRWQYRLDWFEGIVACGCHLTRPVLETLTDHGFEVSGLRSQYLHGAPSTHGWITVGRATPVP